MGEERAGYAKELVDQLSFQLNERFGKGFSATNLKLFRLFYLAYTERDARSGTYPAEFMPSLGWSHYRELTRERLRIEESAAQYRTQNEGIGHGK